MITYTAMLTEAVREMAMRRQVYPKLVINGRMKQDEADRRILVMQAIIDTLSKLSEKERLI